MCDKIMAFETISGKGSDIFLLDNDMFRPQKAKYKIQRLKNIFICKRTFLTNSLLLGEIQLFIKKGSSK